MDNGKQVRLVFKVARHALISKQLKQWIFDDENLDKVRMRQLSEKKSGRDCFLVAVMEEMPLSNPLPKVPANVELTGQIIH